MVADILLLLLDNQLTTFALENLRDRPASEMVHHGQRLINQITIPKLVNFVFVEITVRIGSGVKKLHLLVIKSFVGPLILTFFFVIFILLMQFLWKNIPFTPMCI